MAEFRELSTPRWLARAACRRRRLMLAVVAAGGLWLANSEAVAGPAGPKLPTLRIRDAGEVVEGDAGMTFSSFEVTLSTAPRADSIVSVEFETHDGTASDADSDYVAIHGTLWFGAGQISQQVTIPVLGDLVHEPDETYFVELSNPIRASIVTPRGVATIQNDDASPVLSISDVAGPEGFPGEVSMRFVVSLGHPANHAVSVRYATRDGSARTADRDYVAASGTLVIPARAAWVHLPITIIGDWKPEPDESFLLTLRDPIGAELGESQAVGTILNDDTLPTLSIEDATVAEGNAGTTPARFRVVLSHPVSYPVEVSFATVAGSAQPGEDFLTASGAFRIAAGDTADTISVDVIGDTVREDDETFGVEIHAAARVTVADNRAIGVITNDDRLVARLRLAYGSFPPYSDGTLAPAWGDYDLDGRPDLPLYHNGGPAGFSEIPGFRAILAQGNFHGSAWCDYDRDGRLDLVITGYAEFDSSHTLLFHQSSDGTFTNVAPALGLDVVGHGETAVWADFDGDGWPDLYIPYYPYVPPYRSMLYHNDGGTFTEIGEAAGVALIGQPAELKAEGATAADWDGDGDIDLYTGSHLFSNDGTGRFTDVRAQVGLPETFDEGAMFVDADNDGDLDFYLRDASGPRLFRNDAGHFTETTAAAGLPPVPEFMWGDSWADVDNDGDLDLVYFVRQRPGCLMLNRGDATFVRDPGFESLDIYVDMSCWADVDGDGDLDLLVGSWPKYLCLNDLSQEPGYEDSYLRVLVLDDRGHQSELGVTVRLERLDDLDDAVQTRVVGSGASYLSQNEYPTHFGVTPEGTYALEVVFPGRSGGRVVVDRTVDPNLGAIMPRRLIHKTIVVYRDGRVLIDPMQVAGAPGGAPAPGGLRARPNPVRAAATLSYTLDRPARVSLTVFDVNGRWVRSLGEGVSASGTRAVSWDVRDDRGVRVRAGIYFVRLRVNGRPAGLQRIAVLD